MLSCAFISLRRDVWGFFLILSSDFHVTSFLFCFFFLVLYLSHPAGTLLCPWSVLTCDLKLLRLAGMTSLSALLWQSLCFLVLPQLKCCVTYQPPFGSLNSSSNFCWGCDPTLSWPHLYCMSGQCSSPEMNMSLNLLFACLIMIQESCSQNFHLDKVAAEKG